ncbi:ctpF [Scenedesmus sp. PABB004]|nr:ctpF [Scenedesmus sp. PABB004]
MATPPLARLSKRSTGLARLSKKSAPVALDKASIISLAKRSQLAASVDGAVAIDADGDEIPWHAVDTAAEVVADLASDAERGLSGAEAARRLTDFGPNRLTPPDKPGVLRKVWDQLNNVLIFILTAAAIVEGALQSWAEFGLVLGVILVNTAIGLIQEGKAERAAEAIKAMLSQSARVLRGGELLSLPADALVPGDIVQLRSGDKVPADMRLIAATNLQVQEAMLTGESVPVSKSLAPARASASLGDRRCMVFSATNVTSGAATGVVVGTGDSAEIGQISRMVSTVSTVQNNLLRQLEILGRWLAILVAIIALVAFLLALLRARLGFKLAFESAVAIAVAIIPEGLPAMVTIVLAIGTTVMARNNAIIRQLPAVETLGSLTIICSDKTGTLTKNEMTVVALRTAAGPTLSAASATRRRAPSRATTATARATARRSRASRSRGCRRCWPAGLRADDVRRGARRVASVPFESEHKFMATVHEEEGGRRVLYVKGAPERLLPLCSSQVAGDDLRAAPVPLDAGFWTAAQAELSSRGLRVLALCRAELPADFDLSGLTAASLLSSRPLLSMVLLAAILDPPRPEAIEAIRVAHAAGISVKMITGDHALTALAIGRMLGIAPAGGRGVVFTGPEVDRTSDAALRALVGECSIFARASPENKLRIVRALQELRHTVAMTGDGVNDAPALKAADVGVAMGITGTDVSKEAAKMVLADDNFASIVAAVREGRRVWDNIRKILIFNLPVNLAQGTSILWSFALGLPAAPLTALQVLLVNLVTSVTLGLALAAEPAEADIMTRPPRRQGKRLVGKMLLWRCLLVCHLVVVLVIGMFYWAGRSLPLPQARAEAFNVLVGAQVAYFVNCRFLKASCLHPRVLRGNRMVYVSVPATLALMVLLTFTPGLNAFFGMSAVSGVQAGRIAVCMAAVFIIVEVEKALVDPLLMPLVRPLLAALEAATPACLAVDAPLSARLARACGGRRRLGAVDAPGRAVQRRGKARAAARAAAEPAPAGEPGAEAGLEPVTEQHGEHHAA